MLHLESEHAFLWISGDIRHRHIYLILNDYDHTMFATIPYIILFIRSDDEYYCLADAFLERFWRTQMDNAGNNRISIKNSPVYHPI